MFGFSYWNGTIRLRLLMVEVDVQSDSRLPDMRRSADQRAATARASCGLGALAPRGRLAERRGRFCSLTNESARAKAMQPMLELSIQSLGTEAPWHEGLAEHLHAY